MAESFLKQLAKELAPYLIEAFREELRSHNDSDEWVDQRSPKSRVLGRNRFCKAVRERLERNPQDPHARIIGDKDPRYLLDAVGLAEEMERANVRPSVAKVSPPADPEAATAERVLRLLKGAE